MTRSVLVGLALAGWASLASSAQSPPPEEEPTLAEAAARAKKTRPKPEGKKVLTNDDLKNARGNVIVLPATPEASPGASPAPAASAVPAGPSEAAPLPVPADEIQGRMDELSGRVTRLLKSVEEAQRELAEGADADRQAALTRSIDEARKNIIDAELMILGLEEAARRYGVAVTRP